MELSPRRRRGRRNPLRRRSSEAATTPHGMGGQAGGRTAHGRRPGRGRTGAHRCSHHGGGGRLRGHRRAAVLLAYILLGRWKLRRRTSAPRGGKLLL